MFNKTLAMAVRGMRTDARHSASHIMRLIIAINVLLCLYFVHQMDVIGVGAPGLMMFTFLIWSNMIFTTFAAPLFFANAISEEKEERTLALLKIANVSAGTILIGKIVPRIASLLLILIVQLPFMLLAVALGGVSGHQIAAGFSAILSYVVMMGCIGLFASVVAPTTNRAVFYATIMSLIFLFSPLIVWLFYSTVAAPIGNPSLSENTLNAIQYLSDINIFVKINSVLTTGFSGDIFSSLVYWNLGIGVFLFIVSWIIFPAFNRDTEKSAATPLLAQTSRSSFRVWGYPIAWKEFFYSVGGIRMIICKIVGYGFLAFLVTGLIIEWDFKNIDLEEAGYGIFFPTLFFVIPLEITLNVGAMINFEIKSKTLGTMVTLPVSVSQILFEKAIGGLLSLIPAMFYLFISVLLAPEIIANMVQGIAEEPFAAILVPLQVVLQFAFYLHLVLLFSLWMNRWFAMILSLFVYYTCFTTFMVLFFFSAVIVTGPGEWGAYLGLIVSTIVMAGGIIGLHIGIINQIKRKATFS